MTRSGVGPHRGALLGLFTPWLYAIASKIRQVSLQEMTYDAGVMAAGVIDSGKLFKPPAICINFDTTLWAEAVGCVVNRDSDQPIVEPGGSADPNPDTIRESKLIVALLEVIGRVKGTMVNSQIVCAIPGPATLANHLDIPSPITKSDQFIIGELITEYVNILCSNNVENILILERPNRNDEDLSQWIEGNHYARIVKLAEHYTVETTLLCPGASMNELQVKAFDGFTYVAGNPVGTMSAPFENAAKAISVCNFGTGKVTIPEGVEKLARGSYLLTTEWDLDPSCDFKDIQSDIAVVSEFLEEANG